MSLDEERRRRGTNGRPPEPPTAALEAERIILGALLGRALDPDAAPCPWHFASPALGTLVARAVDLRRRGLACDAGAVLEALPESERPALQGELLEAIRAVEACSGPEELRLALVEATREVRAAALWRERRRVAGLLADPSTDLAECERALDVARSLGEPARPALELAALGVPLEALRLRTTAPSPLPGLLPAEPALVALVARPKVAKTRLALSLAQAWAAGVAPWPGAPALPGTAALVVSAEEPAERVARTLRELALLADPRREGWEERLTLVARDAELLPDAARPLLCLDHAGLDVLRGVARGAGLVVLDSLSRLVPPGTDERTTPAR